MADPALMDDSSFLTSWEIARKQILLRYLLVQYKHGHPVLVLPLPSRQEKCLFQLRPMLSSVIDFIHDIQREDEGVTASVLTTDGVRIASTTSMQTLLNKDFHLCINEVIYRVQAAPTETVPSEAVTSMAQKKNMVQMLHTVLNLPKHHLMREWALRQKMDILKQELVPLEQMKACLDKRAERRSSHALWFGLALLSMPCLTLAIFTNLYSWDILEPAPYFTTYFTSMMIYAYYIHTNQNHIYPDAEKRLFLHYFYQDVEEKKFNVEKYNTLREELASVENNLKGLRKPNQLKLPMEQINPNSQAALLRKLYLNTGVIYNAVDNML